MSSKSLVKYRQNQTKPSFIRLYTHVVYYLAVSTRRPWKCHQSVTASARVLVLIGTRAPQS